MNTMVACDVQMMNMHVIMLLHLCKTCIERSGCYVCGEHLIATLQ